ncbi:MAG: hypothetical protein PHC75_09885, partial [Burkholderiales bacterium]|nr:hypothetical protein [Burkholderiales bacterium]
MRTKIKKIIILSLSATALISCNSGDTKTQGSLNYQAFVQQYKSNLKEETSKINLNLYNSLFISPEKEYTYQIKNIKNDIINQGNLTCKNLNECLIQNVEVQKNSMYLISIIDKSNNTFVGGTTFDVRNGTTYFALAIDDVSTANYISVYMQQKLENQFEVVQIENKLFSKSMSYKKNTSLPQIIYAYYNYLKTNKSQSHDEALKIITDEYIACQLNNSCSLDSDFIKNEQSVIDALNKADQAIEKYAQDKKDASLYESYKWYKENIKNNFDKYKDATSGGIDTFFPGTAGKITGNAGKIFNGIEAIFNLNGLDDSKAAYDRIQLFNNNLSKYYIAATPNYSEIANRLSAELLSLQVRTGFLEKGYYIVNDQQIINNNLLGKGLIEFINNTHKDTAMISFEWIKNAWSIDRVNQRKTNIEYITSTENIKALATAYKTILKTTPENNINNIKNRQDYNQLLMSNMQDAITALQASMYLDMLAVMMKDKNLDFKGALDKTSISVATISLSGAYDNDIANLNSYYSTRFNSLKQSYEKVILAEKEFVADNVLQSVEVEGKCLITGTDGINTLNATCPYYYKEGNVIKTQYFKSDLDKPASRCLTINNDASGDITKIADVRNILGSLQCLTQNNNDGNPLVAIEPFADINSGNSWYWDNSNYFYPNMQGHRVAFLNSPNGSFKFNYLSKSSNSYKTTEQFNLSDITVKDINNFNRFYTFITDNNNNILGGFTMSEFTYYGKSRPLFVINSTYSNSKCSFPSTSTNIGSNYF